MTKKLVVSRCLELDGCILVPQSLNWFCKFIH